MNPRSLRAMDAVAAALLLIWTGLVAGFATLMAPLLFSSIPSRDFAGMIAAKMVTRLDMAAFLAFGLALLLVWVPRWLGEVQDTHVLGPLRLWGAAALAALLICFASAFIISPKLHTLRTYMEAPVETLAPQSPLRTAYRKAHGISRQFMGLRVLLALGLAAGVTLLPRPREEAR